MRASARASGNAYLTGTTSSSFFPTTTGAFETTRPNSTSFPTGYVTKVNPAGTASVWSTYFGNRGSTTPRAIALDSSTNVYIAGEADAQGFPVALGGGRTFNMDLDNNNVNKYAFAARLSADGTHGDWFSKIGGFHCASGATQCFRPRPVANAIAVDSTQAVWIAGTTESNRLPLVKPLNTTFSASGADNLAV